MDKPSRVRQWYGYMVCLVAVVSGLIFLAAALNHGFDLSDPLTADGRFDESLTSFEAFKATHRERMAGPDAQKITDTTSDATLRERFEALRADRIAQRRFQARKGFVTDLVMLLAAVTLFVTHWRWLRRLPEPDHA